MTLFVLIAVILIFCLCIGIAVVAPMPKAMPWLRNVLYIIIMLVAIVVLASYAGCNVSTVLNRHV